MDQFLAATVILGVTRMSGRLHPCGPSKLRALAHTMTNADRNHISRFGKPEEIVSVTIEVLVGTPKNLFRVELTDSDRITRAKDFGGAWPTALTY